MLLVGTELLILFEVIVKIKIIEYEIKITCVHKYLQLTMLHTGSHQPPWLQLLDLDHEIHDDDHLFERC